MWPATMFIIGQKEKVSIHAQHGMEIKIHPENIQPYAHSPPV